ncbi:multidrug ABC transporter [Dulcicalothrix desertica PCC 7102]|uniref:Multidrug ABC transporter n=1 Tax=Dulcicalothrix desertica PCC 7102 TaxID=232991 RepID=A0A433VVS7_9CYAN|nr:efflux RND transporter permease subunit [Dulcicalothrix desertica]RUT10193.1 multidrug ABC transporter [Dulcicalothrix desertica PCC 7102]TWH40825.1 multidrug efflux pump subunit AcrB [Dulcicalothrix desertica PCC 7102]
MKIIETAVRWRHGTFVLFCLLAVFGILSLLNLPLELQPGGDRPEITISTTYPGAGPTEVEDLITRPIEERMEEVLGVQEISSTSRSGRSTINLEFTWGSDVDERLVDVLNRLQQVERLPEEAGESAVEIVSGTSSPMMWIPMAPKPGFKSDPNRNRDLAEEVIIPRLRRVEGTGQFLVVGGQQREVEVRVDPKALAERNLAIGDVVRVLRENNRDIRGGPLILGRREYRVRTVSRSQDMEQIAGFVLRRDASGTVYLRDVAQIQMGRKPQDSALLFNDNPTVAIGVIRRIGANVPDVAKGVRAAITELEAQFDRAGEGIKFIYNYDESEYINQSVTLVQENLISGSLLAVIVLLLFLGSMRTVAVIALTIPTTMITVFIAMAMLGRTLNIISLAALGFTSGMVVDNAIVVVENAFTHMQQGKNPVRATIDGTKEVAGGVFGATLTNVAVFAPLVLVQGEIAQLFTDMAIVITAASLLSMLAAVTLVPMLSGLFLNQNEALQVLDGGKYRGGNWFVRSVANTSAVFRVFQTKLENILMVTVGWSTGNGRLGRRLFILSIPIGLMVASIFLLPPADYLPEGNRNLVLWRAEPMPGTSIPEAIRQSEPVRAYLRKQPEVERVMYVDRPGAIRGIAAILKPEFATSNGLAMMIERMRKASNNFAGYRFMVPNRISIFRDPGKEFEVDIVGADLNQLSEYERDIMGKLRPLPGVRNVRSNYVGGAAELQVIPNRERLAEVGIAEAEVGSMVEAALGGRLASEFIDGKEELDVSVELKDLFVQTPEQLRQLPLYTNRGQVQLSDVAEVKETVGPDVINHVDLERSITLTVTLESDAPLGSLVQRTQQDILAPIQAKLPAGYRIELSGSADRLGETVTQLATAFVLSIFIIYLLLVALYRSFLYPVVIMATVPMGMSGALLSLVIANSIPGVTVPLDMITALGFIILTGVVVNTSILIVERALQLLEEGMDYDKATYQATKDRLRAIFMSAITSVLGMLPLAVVPGQGAELYQGLGIVLTGGLLFSTILTPTVVPALMGLIYDLSGKRQLKKSRKKQLAPS